METHRTTSLEEAEAWNLAFWQRRSPEERLSALVAIHRDIELVIAARNEASGSAGGSMDSVEEDARVLRAVKESRKPR